MKFEQNENREMTQDTENIKKNRRVKSEKEMYMMKKKEEIPRSSGGSARGRTVGDGRGAAHDATSSITVS